MSNNVRDNTKLRRFELETDGHIAFSEYKRGDGVLTIMHTEVPKELEGRGIGSALAKGALDDVRAEGATVVPLCPFIAGWIARHADYEPLVDHELVSHIDGR